MSVMDDAQTLWDYHQMHHEPRATDIAIGLGSHDIGVAEHTADLYNQGMFPLIVFRGANTPTTVDLFPRGEAVHYAERAAELGVPRDAILTETRARNTGENFTLTTDLLHDQGIEAHSAGYAEPQAISNDTMDAYRRLVDAGYTRRLIDRAST
jgi:hypothetical protein